MIKTVLSCLMFFIVSNSFAQQDCIVLIDADQDQPFYTRIGDRTYHSSAIGHLTIPHLKDSTYQIAIGFPENRYPENRFQIRVNKKDQGFQLRYLNEKGWALYNWQTRELKMPLGRDSNEKRTGLERGIKRDDAFSRLMAGVVNDSSVMYNTYEEVASLKDTSNAVETRSGMNPEAPKTGTQLPAAIPVAAKGTEMRNKEPDSAEKFRGVRKIREKPLKNSLRQVYVVFSKEGKPDTVTLFIAYEKGTGASGPKKAPGKPSNQHPEAGGGPDTLRKAGMIFSGQDSVVRKSGESVVACQSVASDQDIDRLRINILSRNELDGKLEEVEKFLKTTCISVKQIRALTELFAYDEARYLFFRKAYPFVFDKENVGQLAGAFTEKAYSDRFLATL